MSSRCQAGRIGVAAACLGVAGAWSMASGGELDVVMIPAGEDCWTTRGDGESVISFAETPIPAGFFGPGSDPYTGPVKLCAGGTDEPDTVVLRQGDIKMVADADGGPVSATVPIEVVHLDLVSCEPILVTYGDSVEPEEWQVNIGTQPGMMTGEMTIHWETIQGGTFDTWINPGYTMVFINPGTGTILELHLEELGLGGPDAQLNGSGAPWLFESPADGTCGENFTAGWTREGPETVCVAGQGVQHCLDSSFVDPGIDPFTCEGFCGGSAPGGCWCDDLCGEFDDCCEDVCDACPDLDFCDPGIDPYTCEGFCGDIAPGGCWCDDWCCHFGDCCDDREEQCGECQPSEAPRGLCFFNDDCSGQTAPLTTCEECEAAGSEWSWLRNGECITDCDDAPQPDSCAGSCGGQSPFGCWCDEDCEANDDCCDDVCDECPGLDLCDPGIDPYTCEGFCGEMAPGGCWCDDWCEFFDDCCDDVCDECDDAVFCDPGIDPYTCEGFCGGIAPGGCWCDALCCEFGDCCEDQADACNFCDPGIDPFYCAGDLNDDGAVNVFDLLELLQDWGPCPPAEECHADLNDDGVVNVFDLLQLLENWGECEQAPAPNVRTGRCFIRTDSHSVESTCAECAAILGAASEGWKWKHDGNTYDHTTGCP
ncbi:MAG: hypothetical protein EA377_02100 [Phycisphaerales bacterium]|nr:MAG: hypothetical protein EA377_02100 [Phycisphaerales bacterium]